ncbi:MAG: hypothetical protein WBF75_03990, partial [Pseudonocardiaceae bacterium]
MQTRPERRKPGRKSKGPRVQVPVRLPTEFYEAVEQIAKRDGIWITDVVTRMVAESLGRPAPDYCQPTSKSQQEERHRQLGCLPRGWEDPWVARGEVGGAGAGGGRGAVVQGVSLPG